MLSTMICALSLAWLPQATAAPEDVAAPEDAFQTHAPSFEVRLRTVDAKGERIPDCPVWFVQADAPGLRPLAHPEPIAVRSNERGQVFAALPAGHAWRVFAWKSRPGGAIASELRELCTWTEVRDLVLRRPHLRTIQLAGLSRWRKALPDGLRIQVDVRGLFRAPVTLPDPGEEKVQLPPMPDSDLFSISLEHERFGTVERFLLQPGGWLDPRFVISQDDTHMTVDVGQPVKVSGKVLGVIDEPMGGARIWLLLPEAAREIPLRPIRADAQGRYELWFPWRPLGDNVPAPELLISAPGQLLHRDSLDDLCRWLTIKTEDRIDPKSLEGLDMAENRTLRLERAFTLDWTVDGARPTDKFFIQLRLPVDRKPRVGIPTFLLPVAVDDQGRLELPGDRLVKREDGKVWEKARLSERVRGLELYLLRDGFCELLTQVKSTEPMAKELRFDLASRRSKVLQVTAGGNPVIDARFQVIRDLGDHPFLSVARAVGNSGKFRIEIGEGSYWVLAESRRKGQAWLRIGKDGQDEARLELLPFRRLTVRTDHPSPDIARLPLRLYVGSNFGRRVPRLVKWMLSSNERVRPARVLEGVPESFVVQMSPWATSVRISVHEPSDRLRQFRTRQGRAHVGPRELDAGPAELRW